ncbi:MAG TPA: NAD-dependent epimerase/dehydratase family protein [Gaiella sp.]|nr:NAD-dependent epimerase/dehydratase family protein [Gaiella sp.]
MRIFLAGASGVIGTRLVPLLVATGHEVAGMTRSPDKADLLRRLGATPVVCDVYDREALRDAVVSSAPDAVVHELTDLPDDASALGRDGRNARIRREGTRNLLTAAHAAGARRFLAQSVAWELEGDGAAAKAELERLTLEAGGVVLRYGRLYGPETYYPDTLPPPPRIHVDEAARLTVALFDAPSGVVELVEDG